MKIQALSASILLGLGVTIGQIGAAVAQGMWAGRFPVPLQEYLDYPFDMEDACWNATDSGLTAADIHLLGRPKRQTETFIAFDENGTETLNTKTITNFSRSTEILNSTSLSKNGEFIGSNIVKYDAFKRPTEINSLFPKEPESCRAKFSYDHAGHLTLITINSETVGDGTITIQYAPDGRPVESLLRRSTGKAERRLVYSYKGNTIAVQNFFNDKIMQGDEKAVFHMDAEGRPVTIEYTSNLSPPGGTSAVYKYTYLPNGMKLMHVEQTSPKGANCIFDFSLHRNGEVDMKSIKLIGDRDLWCSLPDSGGPPSQISFDRHGNKVSDRQGDYVQELGKSIVRWKYVVLDAISYYSSQ